MHGFVFDVTLAMAPIVAAPTVTLAGMRQVAEIEIGSLDQLVILQLKDARLLPVHQGNAGTRKTGIGLDQRLEMKTRVHSDERAAHAGRDIHLLPDALFAAGKDRLAPRMVAVQTFRHFQYFAEVFA